MRRAAAWQENALRLINYCGRQKNCMPSVGVYPMRRLGSAFLALFCSVFLPACDVVNLPEIKPGITAQSEVRSRMGEPGFVHHDADGSIVWEYTRQPSGRSCYMIRFDAQGVVSEMAQVLSPPYFSRALPGMKHEEIRRLLGQPARKQIFENLGEEVWEWRVTGENPLDDSYFNVYFNLHDGQVKKSGFRIEPKG